MGSESFSRSSNQKRGGVINLPSWSWRGKEMEKQRFWGVVALGALLVVFAAFSPAVGEVNQLGGDERPVTEALGTSSQEFRDWTAAWVYFDVVETGAIASTASEEPWMREYGVD
ncbi:MAG: hypothetical protein ACXW4N_05380 [Candidatus Deferrimicrobiaceae bacterium]